MLIFIHDLLWINFRPVLWKVKVLNYSQDGICVQQLAKVKWGGGCSIFKSLNYSIPRCAFSEPCHYSSAIHGSHPWKNLFQYKIGIVEKAVQPLSDIKMHNGAVVSENAYVLLYFNHNHFLYGFCHFLLDGVLFNVPIHLCRCSAVVCILRSMGLLISKVKTEILL